MRIISINLGSEGSTGNIMKGISKLAEDNNIEAYCAYPYTNSKNNPKRNDIVISSNIIRRFNYRLDYLFGTQNCMAWLSTLLFIYKINKIKPDIVHLHNVHSGYINIILLFTYLNIKEIKVVWTLHDCWSFTGRCPHFLVSNCSKWENGCFNCPYPNKAYPASLWDNSKIMWKLKRKLFTSVKDMTIITPSEWLAKLVRRSFLDKYNIKVINNGINLRIFKPRESNFRKQFKIKDEIVILGVSFDWSIDEELDKKGLNDFIKLSQRLDDRYRIILVGTNNNIDRYLPKNIISVHKTSNQIELAEIYSAADIFVNPTKEDTFPTVNIESLACGTPVITYDVGGSPEILDNSCGKIVECGNVRSLEKEIINMGRKSSIIQSCCTARARNFLKEDKFQEYISLYKHIEKRKNI